jgi:ribose transport system substrate-binding protein
MKKLFAILLALAMVLSMVACAAPAAPATEAAPAQEAPATEAAPAEEAAPAQEAAPAEGNKALKLASHNAVIEGNPYRVRYELDIQDACKDASNYGYDVSYNTFVSNWDAATESQQLQNSINEGYDIILVNPVATTGLDPIIEAAQDAGITYINADCAYMSTDVNILNICTDQYYLGYKTGSYAGQVLGEGAKVVMIAALDGNQANTDRQNGFQKAIDEYKLEVVATANHDWDTTKSQEKMAEILNSGVQFDGVLVSQCAENALAAFDAAGVPYPKFIGFGDTGAFMQKMLEVNKDEIKTQYIVLSNPPGVGATALNFGLNLIGGKTLKDGVYAEGQEATHQIWIPSKVCYTDKEQADYVDFANSYEAGDSITFWLTVQEVADTYFN